MNHPSRAARIVTASLLALAALGYLWPFWPLSALGVALLSLSGRWSSGILAGLLLDLAWGVPVGLLHYTYAPFTLLAVLCALARYFGAGFFIERGLPERL